MVNLDKWEEIDYGKIKRHDLIRCITVQGDVVNDTRGVVNSYDCLGVRNKKGVKFVVAPEHFKPIPGGSRKIYRRKAKEFVFPTKTLAIIEGTYRWGSEKPRRYVLTEQAGWRSAITGEAAVKVALQGNFKDWKVISEGIDD